MSLTANGDVLTRAQIGRIGASRMAELFEGRFAGVQVVNARGTRASRGVVEITTRSR